MNDTRITLLIVLIAMIMGIGWLREYNLNNEKPEPNASNVITYEIYKLNSCYPGDKTRVMYIRSRKYRSDENYWRTKVIPCDEDVHVDQEIDLELPEIK